MTPCAATRADGTAVRPIVAGDIVDWDALEAVLHHALVEQLGWPGGGVGGEWPLLIVEPALAPRAARERLAQLAFEQLQVPAYFAADAAVAALAAVGRTTGVVVDFGHEKTDVVPVVDGLLLPSAAARLPVGGAQLTALLGELLAAAGRAPAGGLPPAAAEALKRACLRVAASPEEAAAASRAPPMAFALPDGQSFEVGGEGAALGEALLGGGGGGAAAPALPDALAAAIAVAAAAGAPGAPAERDARRALAEGLLLCGGGAAAPGLAERVLAEARARAHAAAPPALAPYPEYLPRHAPARAAWVGGAVLAKVVFAGNEKAGQPRQRLTRADYEEGGPAAVHRRCS